MIDAPQVTQSEARRTAVIHLTIPKDQIQHVMGPAIGEVMAALAAQGLAPAGPVFSHHFRIFPDGWDFEIGMPVASPVTATGRVVPAELRAARVARTIYHGPYEGLGAAWGELDAWVQANGHPPASDLWEFYASGPESSPDPANWRTELNRPLAD